VGARDVIGVLSAVLVAVSGALSGGGGALRVQPGCVMDKGGAEGCHRGAMRRAGCCVRWGGVLSSHENPVAPCLAFRECVPEGRAGGGLGTVWLAA